MKLKSIFLGLGLLFIVAYIGNLFYSANSNEEFSERVKVAIREVGNLNLLTNQDSNSLVMPIIELEANLYQLTFETELAISPDSLSSIVKQTFAKAELPKAYRLEVLQCEKEEVSYSFEVKEEEKSTIIPCRSRALPEDCYTIQIRFTKVNRGVSSIFLLLIGGVLILISFSLKRKKNETLSGSEEKSQSTLDYLRIGSYQFYPNENKLIKSPTEISLSRKECELLEILVAKKNQVVKREELMKRVWEDNGVVVGRSLDTYISKLRKKFKDDSSIKLSNVHGVGYKLETSQE